MGHKQRDIMNGEVGKCEKTGDENRMKKRRRNGEYNL